MSKESDIIKGLEEAGGIVTKYGKPVIEAADPALLAVIQEQQVILGRVKALADSWDDKYGPGSNADEVLGPQKVSIRFAVEMIRAALTATEAAQ